MQRNRDEVKLHSSINARRQKEVVMWGSLWAGVGALILLASGVLLPQEHLEIWGIPLFALAVILIIWGLLPYRRLSKLLSHPYELRLTQQEIQLRRQGKPIITIPMNDIEGADFFEKGRKYGIAMELKNPLPSPLTIHNRQMDGEKWMARNRKQVGKPLFLPYFSRAAYEELEAVLQDVMHPD